MDMKIEYQVVSLDEVMRYFAKGFELPPGREIWRVEPFIDAAKGKVVFQLTTRDNAP